MYPNIYPNMYPIYVVKRRDLKITTKNVLKLECEKLKLN